MSHELLLAFDSDNPEFVRGFEAGHAWALLDADANRQDFTLHASNAEVAIRIAEATGRSFRTTYQDDDWIVVEYEEASP